MNTEIIRQRFKFYRQEIQALKDEIKWMNKECAETERNIREIEKENQHLSYGRRFKDW